MTEDFVGQQGELSPLKTQKGQIIAEEGKLDKKTHELKIADMKRDAMRMEAI